MQLRRDICLGTLDGLPPTSKGVPLTLSEQLNMIKTAGYEGVVAWDHWSAIQSAGLIAIGMARLLIPQDALDLAKRHKDAGLEFTTLHVGTGFETSDEMNALAEAVLDAMARTGHALHIETHRATMTQDIYRTLQLAKDWPDLAFTLDFSHWYTGHEMTYGGEFLARLDRLLPIFSQVRSLQVRMGDTGRIQRLIEVKAHFVRDHLHALKACIREITDSVGNELKTLSIAPELLGATTQHFAKARWICYAEEGEQGDRFEEALALSQLVETRCGPIVNPVPESILYT